MTGNLVNIAKRQWPEHQAFWKDLDEMLGLRNDYLHAAVMVVFPGGHHELQSRRKGSIPVPSESELAVLERRLHEAAQGLDAFESDLLSD